MLIPLRMTFQQFASQIRIDLPLINFPIPPNVAKWKEWAQQVIHNNDLLNIPLPTDIMYKKEEDWKKWAAYFIDTVYNTK